MISIFHRKPSFQIRRLEAAAIPQCAAIHSASFASGWSEAEIEALQHDPAVQADTASDAAAGSVYGFALSRKAMDEAEILTIAVRSDVQNMGIGKSLAEKHILNLNYAGIKFIFLEVSEENKNALSLYNCLGFHVVGRRDGYYAGPNGKRVSALTMKLTIP